jgi:hypothetical protein
VPRFRIVREFRHPIVARSFDGDLKKAARTQQPRIRFAG